LLKPKRATLNNNKEYRMNLTILFKIQAVYVWFYAAMLWFAPEFAATGPGWYVEGTDMASNFKGLWASYCCPTNWS
jgi:hypothetical protein